MNPFCPSCEHYNNGDGEPFCLTCERIELALKNITNVRKEITFTQFRALRGVDLEENAQD
jgi:hypothetical protein